MGTLERRRAPIAPKVKNQIRNAEYEVSIDNARCGDLFTRAGVPTGEILLHRINIVGYNPGDNKLGVYYQASRNIYVYADNHWSKFKEAEDAAIVLANETKPKLLGKTLKGPLLYGAFQDSLKGLSDEGRKHRKLLLESTRNLVKVSDAQQFRDWLAQPRDIETARALLLDGINAVLIGTLAHEIKHVANQFNPLFNGVDRKTRSVVEGVSYIGSVLSAVSIGGQGVHWSVPHLGETGYYVGVGVGIITGLRIWDYVQSINEALIYEFNPDEVTARKFGNKISKDVSWSNLATIKPTNRASL